MMLMACDQSVRGFAYAAAPTFWGGDWAKVVTGRFDGGRVPKGDAAGALYRLHRLFRLVDGAICEVNPNVVGFESYGFSAKPDTNVVELVGALKLRLLDYGKDVLTVNQSSARKLLLGKVPRSGDEAKKAVKRTLVAAGAPEGLSLDVTDAMCILNSMMADHGGLCFANA